LEDLGFYSLLDDVRKEHVKTPFGEPSGDFAIGSLDGREVIFLARHGSKHTIPPAQINYRANLWAMRTSVIERRPASWSCATA